jgi:LysM repeat protein
MQVQVSDKRSGIPLFWLARPKQFGIAVFSLALLGTLPTRSEAIEARFELTPQILNKKLAPPVAGPETKAATKKPGSRENLSRYTVQQGDHLYKVLAREYGITGDRADAVVERIKRLNHLSDIRRLQVGSTLLIPALPSASTVHPPRPATAGKQETLHIVSPEQPPRPATMERAGGAEVVEDARRIWPEMVPSSATGSNHFGYSSSAFRLSLDPDRYPVLPAHDGGTILIDGRQTLPTLVKALIQEENPQVRVVAENPANRRSFYRSLLSASRFYSFEEDFFVEFGTDAKIGVHADFKIEKNPESLLRQEITLLNIGEDRQAAPHGLRKLLAANGFRLLETARQFRGQKATEHRLHQITDKEPKKITDSLLDALAISFQADKNINLYAEENIGVRLEVPVDRYFEDDGQRFVVSLFSGDPVIYTLVRLLETKGYRVIMLQDGDSLQSIADRMLSRIHLPAQYGEHDLWQTREVGYGVRMPGVMIRDSRHGKRNLFITDHTVDPLVQDLADLNGYRLDGR